MSATTGSEPVQKLSLRVLYTVNSSPQYILAKIHEPVPVIRCAYAQQLPEGHDVTQPQYAQAPLKACLTAICNSSPELLQDSSRDFSLYVLDPLEAQPAPPNACASGSSPRGVAVALGLMSCALESEESGCIHVTGTILPGSAALEVVFRFTRDKARTEIHANSLSFQPAPVPQPEHAEPQTFSKSADFPEVYIGPPRRGPGRPEGSMSSKSRSKPKRETSVPSIGIANHQMTENVREKTEPLVSSSLGSNPNKKTKTRVRNPPTPYSYANLSPTVPQHTPQTQHAPQSQQPPRQDNGQSALLALFSALSSTAPTPDSTTANPPAQNATLLMALAQFISTNPQVLNSVPTASAAVPRSSSEKKEDINEADDGDSDIIILDSSVVDPTAFRKRASDSASEMVESYPNTQYLLASDTLRKQLRLPRFVPLKAIPVVLMVMNLRPQLPVTPTSTRIGKRSRLDQSNDRLPSAMAHLRTSPYAGRRISGSGRDIGPGNIKLADSSPPERLPSMLSTIRKPSSSRRTSTLSNCRSPLSVSDMISQQYSPSTSATSPPSSQTASSRISTSVSKPGPQTIKSTVLRKRTLGEFMAEQEARRQDKSKKRESTRRVSAARQGSDITQATQSETSPCRYISLGKVQLSRAGYKPRSSSSQYSASTHAGPSATAPPLHILDSSEPSTQKPTAIAENPLKKFILPAWARTNTATLPRLSEEALARRKAAEEKKEKEAEQRRREAKERRRKGGLHTVYPTRRRKVVVPSKESSDGSDDEDASKGPCRSPAQGHVHLARPMSSMPKQENLPSLPVFASDVIPISSSSPKACPVLLPSTPSRRKLTNAHYGSGKVDSDKTGQASSPPSGSGPLRTPSAAEAVSTPGTGAGSLFSPSGSLFTPSTPTSTARYTFTPKSPSAHRRSALYTPCRDATQMISRTPIHRSPHHTPGKRLCKYLGGSTSHKPTIQTSSGSPTSHAQTANIQVTARTFIGPPLVLKTPTRKNTRTTTSSSTLSGAPQNSPLCATPFNSLSSGAWKTNDPSWARQPVNVSQKEMLNKEPQEGSLGLHAISQPSREANGHNSELPDGNQH
ncbi:hypothetical protein F5J12DRAFT_938454 [Pisolithus orientalis]|uniref:uncharacterized protein n=1 Tax=Pisolithus orientalis TaxID=936130 RepID=UPI0022247EA1|nr:uncharacterized protein F5J12DRAFT_938454 [Pisolithus orientalis]KAI6007659.1 hypothetical protein F5J12DRAFT_938454 [Pisolithus orientalis]